MQIGAKIGAYEVIAKLAALTGCRGSFASLPCHFIPW
jgi:hypothetical protein